MPPAPENIRLRPETPADRPFLRRLILDTIALELGASDWPEPMRGQLLDVQFRARRHARRAQERPAHDAGESFVIETGIDGRPVDSGWLLLARTPHELHLVEIMVSPERRGKGIGSAAIRLLIARAAGTPLRLNVNARNHAAIRLYKRLGFRRTGHDDLQYFMEY